MRETKHSDAPFTIDDVPGCASIYDATGQEIAYLSGLADEDENQANGQLFLAAPDLLAACERMVSYEIDAVASNGTDYDADSALADFEILRAAIAKAEGE